MFGVGIARGMATTLKHLFAKKVTIQYPEERAPLPIGFRGLPRLVYDETPDNLRCVACSICANACPVHVIHIDTHRGPDRKLVLDRFDLEAGGCVFCGFCVEVCPFEALTMMHGFELAAYNREQLLWDKEMLAIKATPQTLADMERIHGPSEKEEKKAAPAPKEERAAPAPATNDQKNGAIAAPSLTATAPDEGDKTASAEPAAPANTEVSASPPAGAPPPPASAPLQKEGPASSAADVEGAPAHAATPPTRN